MTDTPYNIDNEFEDHPMKDDASTGWSISLPPTFVGKSQSLIKKLETAENPEKVVLKIKPRKRLFPKKRRGSYELRYIRCIIFPNIIIYLHNIFW